VVGAAAGAGLALEADLGAGAAGVVADGAGVALEDLGGAWAGAAAGDCAREPVARRRRRQGRRTALLEGRAIASAGCCGRLSGCDCEWQRGGALHCGSDGGAAHADAG